MIHGLRRTDVDARALGLARWLLVAYLVWKLASFPWGILATWPVHIATAHAVLTPAWFLPYAPVEALVACLALVAFAAGVRPRVAAFVSVATLSHLGAAAALVDGNGWTKSLFLAALVVAVFGVCDDRCRVRIRGVPRRLAGDRAVNRGVDDARDRPVADASPLPLRVTLLAVATLYFGAGVAKVVEGPLFAWTSPRSLGSYLLFADVAFTPTSVVPAGEPLVAALLATPALLAAIAWATILLEVGFLPAALARLPAWPFVVGLAGMHAAIAVTMGPFFVDQLVFLALLVDWFRLARVVRRTAVRVGSRLGRVARAVAGRHA